MVRSAWLWLLGAPVRGTHKNKVNEIRPDIRKIAGLPVMRSPIEPLGSRQGISLICLRRLLPNSRPFGSYGECGHFHGLRRHLSALAMAWSSLYFAAFPRPRLSCAYLLSGPSDLFT